MEEIIRGTTPTITYTFSVVNVADITTAYLTIKHSAGMLTKTLSDATVEENSLVWTLSQEDTLSMNKIVSIMINFKLADGTRGASDEDSIKMIRNHVNEVI